MKVRFLKYWFDICGCKSGGEAKFRSVQTVGSRSRGQVMALETGANEKGLTVN